MKLTKPSATDLRQFRHNSAAIVATEEIIDGLRSLAKEATPSSIAVVADTLFPAAKGVDAIEIMLDHMLLAINTVRAFETERKAADEAERDRLKPIVSSATHRLFAVLAEAKGVAATRASAVQQYALKVKNFAAAGLTPEQIAQVEPAPDVAAMQARESALRAEADALERFIASKDETMLPIG